MKKIKLIYTNGDSFVAGDELAIDKFIPEMSKLYRDDEKRTLTERDKQALFDKYNFHDLANHTVYLSESKKLAFPALLEKKLNIPVINNALGGQSNQSICTSTINDLEKLQQEHNNFEILAIIGLTSLPRVKLPEQNGIKSMMLHYRPNQRTKDVISKVQQYFIEHALDDYLLTDSLISILGLVNYFKKKNISYIFVDSGLWNDAIRYSFLADRSISIIAAPTVKLNMANRIQPGEYAYHELGHYSKEIHDRFSDRLIHELLNILKYEF